MVVVGLPVSEAQFVVNDIVKAGLRAILNFAPVNLKVPDNVFVRNENMAMELEYLSYALVNNHSKNRVK